jgi:tRNA 2-thiocytidine biosynthesis protein TtcA
LSLEKTVLRKVADAVTRFRMIREGDRVAVGFSGGKDSLTLLETLLLLRDRAPIHFTVCAFTVDQGKFLTPIDPLREYLAARGVDWTYQLDRPSVRLIDEKPGHGCDLCSRYRRRAVYQIARKLGAGVIAFGHTADDLCESFLRNAMFTGRVASLPPVAWSSEREFRLIRPLIYVTEDLTRAWAERAGAPVVPCGCNQRTGTVRRSIRDIIAELERDYPHLKSTMLAAMGNLQAGRLLDPRYLDPDAPPEEHHGGLISILDQQRNVVTES